MGWTASSRCFSAASGHCMPGRGLSACGYAQAGVAPAVKQTITICAESASHNRTHHSAQAKRPNPIRCRNRFRNPTPAITITKQNRGRGRYRNRNRHRNKTDFTTNNTKGHEDYAGRFQRIFFDCRSPGRCPGLVCKCAVGAAGADRRERIASNANAHSRGQTGPKPPSRLPFRLCQCDARQGLVGRRNLRRCGVVRTLERVIVVAFDGLAGVDNAVVSG